MAKRGIYRLHDLAHAYLRLSLKSSNSLLKGIISKEYEGYFFNTDYDQKFKQAISFTNLYNVLAESLDFISNIGKSHNEKTYRFTNVYGSSSEMSNLDGFDTYSTYKAPSILNSFNVYGLITLYLFNKDILSNRLEKGFNLDEAVGEAADKLTKMKIFPINPDKITFRDSFDTKQADRVIKYSGLDGLNKNLEKLKAELYLTLYYFNKTPNKKIFKKDKEVYNRFLNIDTLTPEQKIELAKYNDGSTAYTEQQMNYIMTCNIENIEKNISKSLTMKIIANKFLTKKQLSELQSLIKKDLHIFTDEQINYIIDSAIKNSKENNRINNNENILTKEKIEKMIDSEFIKNKEEIIERIILEFNKIPKIFSFNIKQTLKDGKLVDIVKMDLNSDMFENNYSNLYTPTPTYMYTIEGEKLYQNSDGQFCKIDGSIYGGDLYEYNKDSKEFVHSGSTKNETKDIVEEDLEERNIVQLTDKNEIPLKYINGEYRYANGDVYKGIVYQKSDDDVPVPYDDQLPFEESKSGTYDDGSGGEGR